MPQTDIAPLIVSAVGALLMPVLLVGPSIANRRRLARMYPDGPFVAEKTFRSVSGMIGGGLGTSFIRGSGALTVELGVGGLRLSSWRLVRRWFPTIVVPWNKITSCVLEEHLFGSPSVKLEFSNWIYSTSLSGARWRDESLAADIVAYWQSAREIANAPKADVQSFAATQDQASV